MTTDTIELFAQAEQEYRSVFDSDIELLDLLVHPDGETGTFFTPAGDVYNFAYVRDSDDIIAVQDVEATQYIEDFAYGYLATQNVPDSAIRGDARGFYLATVSLRQDKMGGKCGRGWESGPGGKCVRSKGGGKLRQGGLGRKAAIGAGALAGAAALGGAALLGGTSAGRQAVQKAKGEFTRLGKNSKAAMVLSPGSLRRAKIAAPGEAAKDLGKGVVEGAKEVGGKIKQGAGTARQKATELGQAAVGKVKEAGSKVREAASSAVSNVREKFKKKGS